ncbi:hypothetical protein K2173_028423 [Erythroxylum novogranatense]|uniref:Uncharacterized protein n=1 Tax=Erythroxylum novogranatense TaxID=1862640 RepID=A0AAV8U1T7_9ROSI|nr:hypothetical protein K2173_028423 [Erythroxylum novogranatense]
MVAAVSTPLNTKNASNQNPTRRLLLSSDPDNAPRRPKSREVTSRYMSSVSTSPSNAKRSPSPSISRPTAVMTPSAPYAVKRSLSVERRRPATPVSNPLDLKIQNGNGVQMSNAHRMLVNSTRSLSVSFQGQSFAFQASKAKPIPSPVSLRKGTPERRKATTTSAKGEAAYHVENSPAEKQRWPGRLRQAHSMARSVDFTDDKKRLNGSEANVSVIRSLQDSMADYRSSIEGRLSSDSNIEKLVDVNGSIVQREPNASDTESVSSGSTSESNSNYDGGQGQRGPRGTLVAARFLQEYGRKLRRQTEPGSLVNSGLNGPVPPKLIAPKRIGIIDSPVSSPKGVMHSRGQLSPIRGETMRHASPSKISTMPAMSPMRGMSPSRMRSAVGAAVGGNMSNLSSMPSILSFAADIRRGRVGENRIVEVHLLRILYNRLLQWRFINARADTSLHTQRMNTEKSLYSAHVTISKLRESVGAKQMELQRLRQNLKLISILRGQMIYLEELELTDQDYSRSLSGAIEALCASTLRLPVVAGARADVHNIKDAIHSAMDVMQTMASSVWLLSTKVREVNSVVGELANTTSNEHALLNQCKDLLSVVAALQVKECSLRTHLSQINRVPTDPPTTE